MKKKILLGLFAFFITTSIFAQKPIITFSEMSYDYGTVAEEDGKVSHVFEFTNSGTSDLLLKNVQASCGCTTPQWSREPVPPKQKGTITVTYRAAGRPGPFTKSITVSSNADKKVLIIKGVVTPRGQKVETAYPILKGDVRLKTETLNFGDIANGESKVVKLAVANVSKKDIIVTFIDLPKHITAETKSLKAGQKANINLTFNSAKKESWGKSSTTLSFITDNIKNKKATKYTINAAVKVFEKFTEAQIKNPPIIKIANEIIAGEVKKGEKKTVVASFTNIGKVPLYIRNIDSKSDFISIKHSTKAVKPGKKGKIKITIDASKLTAKNYKQTITVMSNDPKNVNKHFLLKFNVVE